MSGPAAAGGAPSGDIGEGLALLVSATGLVALSAPTGVQVFWLVLVGGAAAARALAGHRARAGGPPVG